MFTEVHTVVGGGKGDARAADARRMIEALAGANASTIALIGCRYYRNKLSFYL